MLMFQLLRTNIFLSLIQLRLKMSMLMLSNVIRGYVFHRQWVFATTRQSHWLEYFVKKDRAYCFPYFLFDSIPSKNPAFINQGFNSWKRVHDGDKCAFANHEGHAYSQHSLAAQRLDNFKDPSRHIDNMLNQQSSEEILRHRLRLNTSIIALKWPGSPPYVYLFW